MTPYTYLIGWTIHNKWYYGVRTANKVSPNEDLWHIYKGSSAYVDEFVSLHGDPDICEVRHEFETKEAAISWEAKVLMRMKVLQKEEWLNQNICGCVIFTSEIREKMSKAIKGRVPWNKGIPRTEEDKRKTSVAQLGKIPWNKGLTKKDDPRIAAYGKSGSKTLKGRTLTESHKQNIRKAHLEKATV